MIAISLLIATAVPLIFLFVIHRLDLYGMGSFRVVLVCFAWGMASFALAYYANSGALDAGLITIDTLRRYFAPITEEILKALILFYPAATES